MSANDETRPMASQDAATFPAISDGAAATIPLNTPADAATVVQTAAGSPAQTVGTGGQSGTYHVPAGEAPTVIPERPATTETANAGSWSGSGTGALTGGAGATLGATGTFSGTGTGIRRRTRINGTLPADTQVLDERLQLSRVSVFADMADRTGSSGKLTQKLTRMVEDHGTHGRYIVQRPLAQGGMGAVLEIKDGDFCRRSAMKIILPRFARQGDSLERFLAEAQVTAQLEHPNIVPIHDLGVMDDGTLYFTMKFIEGQSLGQVVKKLKDNDADARAHWTLENILLTFLKVLDGVGFANAKGVIHRDIKPDNIMLGAHGEVLVVDWGIAKVMGEADSANELVRQVMSVRDQDNLSQTMAGNAIGTLYYMPPEQAEGRLDDIDARSDVYALGATLYELITLRRPLDHGPIPAMLAQIMEGTFVPVLTARPDLHPDLAAVITRAMALDRNARYQTCAAFSDDLKRFLAGQAVSARQRNLIERLGAWYQQHRKQVLIGSVGATLVAGGIVGTVAWKEQQDAQKAATLREQAKAALASGDLDTARDRLQGAITVKDDPAATRPISDELSAALRARDMLAKQEAERTAARAKATAMLGHCTSMMGTGSPDLEAIDRELDAAYALSAMPEIDALRKKVMVSLQDKRATAERASADAAKVRGDAVLTRIATADDATVDAMFDEAIQALKAAETPTYAAAGLSESRVRLAEMRRAVNQRRQAASDRRIADEQLAKARANLTAGALDEALAAVGAALERIPGDKTADALRLEILTAKQDADRRRLRDANRARARQDLATANQARSLMLAAMERTAAAASDVTRRERLPGDSAGLAAARRSFAEARQVVLEQWSQLEQSAAAVANGLGGDAEFALEDGSKPLTTARRLLADLYWDRLEDARQRQDAVETTAFTALVKRFDDGTYAQRLGGDGTLSIIGSGSGSLHPLILVDGRFQLVAGGPAERISLPLEGRKVKPGRWQLSIGKQTFAIHIPPSGTRSVRVPDAMPSVPGHQLAVVPGIDGSSPFLLGTTEITQRQYHAFITDSAIWPSVQAGFKAAVLDPTVAEILLPRRSPSVGTETWQLLAGGDKGEVLQEATLPKTGNIADLPVTGISRDDAERYCAWLAKRSGLVIRLPTAREWRLAANGGDPQRTYPWGDGFDPSFAVCALGLPKGSDAPLPPGSRTGDTGPFGHRDLAGNVREWLADRPSADDAVTVFHGGLIAGGSFMDAEPQRSRCDAAESVPPSIPIGVVGFRILVEVP